MLVCSSLLIQYPCSRLRARVQDVGEGSHGWESIILQVRDDEPWTGPDRVIRSFVAWTDTGQQAWPVPQGILDLRLALTQTDVTNKIWHIEA